MKTSLFLLTLLISLSTFAQVQRGDNIVDLGASIRSDNIGIERYDGGNLGTLEFSGDGSHLLTQLILGIDYYRMVGRRIGIGGSAGAFVGAIDFTDFQGLLYLTPALRYYAVNTGRYLVYGEGSLGLGVLATEDSEFDLGIFSLAAGVQLPLGTGVLFDSQIYFTAGDDEPALGVSAGLELLLGRNQRSQERPLAAFRRRDVVLGAQSAGIRRTDRRFDSEANLTGDYFLTDRFSLGGALNIEYIKRTFGTVRQSQIEIITFGGGLHARYIFARFGRTAWFGEAGVAYRVSRSSGTFIASSPQRSQNITTVFRGGFQRFLRDNLFISAGPYFNHNVWGRASNQDNTVDVDPSQVAGLHFGIGVVL